MAFGSFDRKTSSQPMAEINMVPLIDVVLVLLVIFIVTAPLLDQRRQARPAQGDVDGRHPEAGEGRVRDRRQRRAVLERRAHQPRGRDREVRRGRPKRPQPEVYLRADQNVPYRYVAETLADASKGGLSQGRLRQRTGTVSWGRTTPVARHELGATRVQPHPEERPQGASRRMGNNITGSHPSRRVARAPQGEVRLYREPMTRHWSGAPPAINAPRSLTSGTHIRTAGVPPAHDHERAGRPRSEL